MEWIILASIWIAVAIVSLSFPSYLKEKGKNLATREDTESITRLVERVRSESARELEELRASIAQESEGVGRRRDIYHDLSTGLRIFIMGHDVIPEIQKGRQDDFLSAYAAAWLWAPDDLIRNLNKFILLNQRVRAEDNPQQRALKAAFVETILSMRRDAGFGDTELISTDYVFVRF